MLIYLICFHLLYYCFLQYLVAAIPPPSFNSIRILWMSWYLSVTLILMCTFAGQMKASMMFKPEKKRIDSVFNVYQKKKLKLYIPKDSIIERLLKVRNALASRMAKFSTVFVFCGPSVPYTYRPVKILTLGKVN